jgi:hypothetical protein
MAYDGARNETVLFGGLNANITPTTLGGDLNDTWVWNGSTWIQRFPSRSPSPRQAYAMAYDSAHGQTVLFGGLVDQPYPIPIGAPGILGTQVNDTWLWDGSDWTRALPVTNPPIGNYTMVYDSGRGAMVLFRRFVQADRGPMH